MRIARPQRDINSGIFENRARSFNYRSLNANIFECMEGDVSRERLSSNVEQYFDVVIVEEQLIVS